MSDSPCKTPARSRLCRGFVFYLTTFILFSSCIILWNLPTWAQKEDESPLSVEDRILIQAVGDLMLGGSAAPVVAEKGVHYPFSATKEILREGDINFANLEGPITNAGEAVEGKTFTFRMDPRVLDGIVEAKINLLSLANNHILDFGPEGLRQTLDLLKERSIQGAGAGMNLAEARRPAVMTAKGYRIGLLAYSLTFPESFYAQADRPGTAFARQEYLKEDIPAARKRVDFLIVSFHWGQELATEPKDYQKRVAHQAIRLGADLVLGHHPHVYQGIEIYRGKPIFYSLGNFAFGSYSHSVSRGLIARIRIGPKENRNALGADCIELAPLNVFNPEVDMRPVLLTDDHAKDAIRELQERSAPFETEIQERQGRGLIALSDC